MKSATCIKFWGVRGSVATPGAETARVSGNTSCVEVQVGEKRLIFDAGTGLRRLGNELMKQRQVDAHIFLSHLHWDHIQGIPFFAPIYRPGSKLHIYGGSGISPLREALHRQMSAPMFPVDLMELPSTLEYQDVRDQQRLEVEGAIVTLCKANHPDSVYAYRVDYEGHSIVYATDTEHYSCVDPRLVKLAKGADVLIYDAQYLPEEYSGYVGMSRVGWGHSTFEAAIELAQAADVDKLVLFHHDPTRSDDAVDALEARAQALRPHTYAAREGMEIYL